MTRVVLYNTRYPMVGLMAVAEQQVTDHRLKKVVWAHPQFQGYVQPEQAPE